ncbi:hypothetical protein WA158_000181 [Blastocystis sp. Blastoise]
MDFQHRVGGKTGSGPISSAQLQLDRRERLMRLAMETSDVSKNPYLLKNHLGKFECKLCGTLHNTEANFLTHTQGRRHQVNLSRRKAQEQKMAEGPRPSTGTSSSLVQRKVFTIGRPGYQVFKQKDPISNQLSLVFEIQYPEIEENLQPRHRFMSAFEQKIQPPDKNFQYIIFAASPYENIAFKIPNREIDKREGRFLTQWDAKTKIFKLQLFFKTDEQIEAERKKHEETKAVKN